MVTSWLTIIKTLSLIDFETHFGLFSNIFVVMIKNTSSFFLLFMIVLIYSTERGKGMLEYKIYTKNRTSNFVVLIHGMGGNSKIFYKQLKEYKKEFNVLSIHLPGHANSPDVKTYTSFSFNKVAEEVIAVLDHLNIKKAHFVGISLGTVIIHAILNKSPERVLSAVMGGAITKINILSKILLTIGDFAKNIMPFIWLYIIFAGILMPKANHKKSRGLFIHEAKKMKRENVLAWYRIFKTVETVLGGTKENSNGIKKLYLSGEEDHFFIDTIRRHVEDDADNSTLLSYKNCGHVCNIDMPEKFNRDSIEFMKLIDQIKRFENIG
jgi:pimeloyl-ACP methyl ester carboxylesterase